MLAEPHTTNLFRKKIAMSAATAIPRRLCTNANMTCTDSMQLPQGPPLTFPQRIVQSTQAWWLVY